MTSTVKSDGTMTDEEMKLMNEFCEQVPDISEDVRDAIRFMLSSWLAWIDEDGFFLCMNDTWAWASGDCERVLPVNIEEVVRLFTSFGHAGLLYWVSERRDRMRSEFYDINRFVEFVRNEERICHEVPDHSARGYHKASYAIGQEA